MARPRQPIEIIELKGKKHLTKEEIDTRKASELKVETKEIIAPKYLPKRLVSKFDEIANRLLDIGIMTDLDTDMLCRYLIAEEQYISISKEYTKMFKKGEFEIVERFSSIQDKAFKQCQTAATALGLTISARCKLVLPPIQEENKKSKFSKIGGV